MWVLGLLAVLLLYGVIVNLPAVLGMLAGGFIVLFVIGKTVEWFEARPPRAVRYGEARKAIDLERAKAKRDAQRVTEQAQLRQRIAQLESEREYK